MSRAIAKQKSKVVTTDDVRELLAYTRSLSVALGARIRI